MENTKNQIAEISVSYNSAPRDKMKISNSNDAYKVLLDNWNIETIELQEEFKVVYLNRTNEILGIYPLSKGGTTSTIVDPKLIFAVALKCNACGIIICHNHPSGNLKPSLDDRKLTTKIKKAGEFLDITLIDHIIISKNGYYSFKNEEGL